MSGPFAPPAAPVMTSLTQHVTALETGAHVAAAAFIGAVPALALADGAVLLSPGNDERRVEAHPDAGLLVAACDGTALITGGDDGRIMRIAGDGAAECIADEKGRWIDAIACGQGGAMAWSTGKRVTARDDKGRTKNWDAPSTAQGLCFAPKGYRLAVSHYNGVSLWFPNAETAPEKLEWKGSHLDVTWSPDGRFVVTSMQESTLHGWRLSDKKDMRMSGYPSKTRSFSWSHDGQWLGTSGADAAIVWPFSSKDGPMGKAPRECGIRPAKVSRVSFHPGALVIAMGYEDGFVLLCRLTDAAELLVRKADPDNGAITALAWDKTGRELLFGTDGGAAGHLKLPA